jgi:hypothetical protein
VIRRRGWDRARPDGLAMHGTGRDGIHAETGRMGAIS